MANVTHSPKLLIPALRPFYDAVEPLSWLIVRLATGGILAWHGWGKVLRGSAMAPAFTQMGYTDPIPMIYTLLVVEFIGGLCIVVGLFTRFWAAAVAIEMGYLFIIYLPNGYSWLNRGYEYVLLWGAVAFAIALRGGGPYSIDRAINKEL
jgi:putative oxidoreductase